MRGRGGVEWGGERIKRSRGVVGLSREGEVLRGEGME